MDHMDYLWELLSWGQTDSAPREIPLIVSMLYYALSAVIGRTLRAAVRNYVNTRWQPYLLDAVTAFQLLSWSLENTQIRRFYGEAAYVGILFTLGMWSHLTIEGSSANPCYHMLRYTKNLQSAGESIGRVLFQLAGGLASFQYARQFWSLGLHSGHSERFATLHCMTDLNVSPTTGFAIEFFSTAFETTLATLSFTSFQLCEEATKCFISCYMVFLGVHLTGMYMNPINATNQSFGCDGTTVLEHIFVYWVAPLSAVALCVWLHGLLSKTRVSGHPSTNGVKVTTSNFTDISDSDQPAETSQKDAIFGNSACQHSNNGMHQSFPKSAKNGLKFRKNQADTRSQKA